MSTLETLQRLTGPNAPEGVDADMIAALEGQLESNRRKPPQRGIPGAHQPRQAPPEPRR